MDIEPESPELMAQPSNTGPSESSYSVTFAPGERTVDVAPPVNTGPEYGSYSYVQPQANTGPSHGSYSYVQPPRP